MLEGCKRTEEQKLQRLLSIAIDNIDYGYVVYIIYGIAYYKLQCTYCIAGTI